MSSTGKVAAELQSPPAGGAPPFVGFFRWDLALRLLVLSSSVASLGMVLSSHQTKVVSVPLMSTVSLEAKFTHSSAFIYFVAASSVVCLYSAVSAGSVFFLRSKASPSSSRLLFLLAFLDALMASVMASASGAVASISYIARKGNSHVGWNKVCDVFDKFCKHMGGALVLGLNASCLLHVLVMISIYSLYRRSR